MQNFFDVSYQAHRPYTRLVQLWRNELTRCSNLISAGVLFAVRLKPRIAPGKRGQRALCRLTMPCGWMRWGPDRVGRPALSVTPCTSRRSPTRPWRWERHLARPPCPPPTDSCTYKQGRIRESQSIKGTNISPDDVCETCRRLKIRTAFTINSMNSSKSLAKNPKAVKAAE